MCIRDRYFADRKDEESVRLRNECGQGSDILDVMKVLCEIRNGRGVVDDIDHLGNCLLYTSRCV